MPGAPANPYHASVPLVCAGRTLSLCFTWDAVALVQAKFGRAEYLREIARVIQERDVSGMAELIAAASGEAAEEIARLSPPIVPAINAIERAWLLAMFGPKMRPNDAPEKPKARTMFQRLKIWFAKLFAPRSTLASAGPSSGA